MKKKQISKKLSFSKSTIAQLDNELMVQALGGHIIYPTKFCTDLTNCVCETDLNCPTIPNQCTNSPLGPCWW